MRVIHTALFVSVAISLFSMTGCVAGRTSEGDIVVGIAISEDPAVAQEKAAAIVEGAGVIGSMLGIPGAGPIAGGLMAAITAGTWQRRQGERKGWDEREEAAINRRQPLNEPQEA